MASAAQIGADDRGLQRVRAHVRKTARPALYLDEPEAMEREGGFEDVHVSAQRVNVGGLSAL